MIIVIRYGKLSGGIVFTSYLGSILLGGIYITIGLLISSKCENQMVSAIIILAVNILLQVLEYIPQLLSTGNTFAFICQLLGWLSLNSRNSEFAAGLLSLANIIYICSFIGILLFLTTRIIEKRRWSEN